nr:MAG TPA: hypothetical protein [Caudoviricetes sp.]
MSVRFWPAMTFSPFVRFKKINSLYNYMINQRAKFVKE